MHPIPKTRFLAALVGACALAASLPACAAADEPKDPAGVVSLNSSATIEAAKDLMSVTFSVTREGADAAVVQAALKEALGAAMAQARRVQKDGEVDVAGGGFSLQPRYNSKGAMNGWTGTTDLLVKGRDMAAIAELVPRITTMTIASLDYSLSREAREKVEAQVSAQAIAVFRAKAADYAKAFGYTTFAVREVNVQTDAGQPPSPRMAFRAASPALVAGEPLPVEAGNGTVTTNVSGTVQMK